MNLYCTFNPSYHYYNKLTYEKVRGCVSFGLCELQPFHHNEDDEVAKDAGHEDHLRDELKVDIQWLPEEPKTGQKCSESVK